jgi:hypothetical protein
MQHSKTQKQHWQQQRTQPAILLLAFLAVWALAIMADQLNSGQNQRSVRTFPNVQTVVLMLRRTGESSTFLVLGKVPPGYRNKQQSCHPRCNEVDVQAKEKVPGAVFNRVIKVKTR